MANVGHVGISQATRYPTTAGGVMLIISPLYTFYQRMNEKPATRKQFCLSGLQDLYI